MEQAITQLRGSTRAEERVLLLAEMGGNLAVLQQMLDIEQPVIAAFLEEYGG